MILKQLSQIEDKSERLDFILKNKGEIKRAKKHAVNYKRQNMPTLGGYQYQFDVQEKATTSENGTFTIVGNSVGFMDSHDDVSMPNSFNKTVKENGSFIQILNSHRSESINDIIAANRGVSIKELPIRSLGYDRDGTTQALVADIEPISQEIAKKYAMGAITQHSIALQYVQLELAVNDPSRGKEYKVWTRTIDNVINQDKAIENGYYWAVFEQKVFEISAVVFGSNQYTPPIDYISENSQEESPSNSESLESNTQENDEPTQSVESKIINILRNGTTDKMAGSQGQGH